MTTTAIELNQVSHIYKAGWKSFNNALKAVDLSIPMGEAFGFVGPNGAGKSTAIRILMGLQRPTSGSAFLMGFNVQDQRARKNVAYVPESPLLYEYLTPLETLELGCSMHNVEQKHRKQHCLQWLKRFDLEHVANKPIRGFSKGMTQRTALAHALAIRPKLMILDEPLSGLDPVGRSLVVDILSEFQANGGTLFFSSHVLYDVERLADRFGIINKGTLRTIQNPEELSMGARRLQITSIGENPIPNMQPKSANTWQIEISADQQWETIDQIRQKGHSIYEVKPVTTLERALLDLIKTDECTTTI